MFSNFSFKEHLKRFIRYIKNFMMLNIIAWIAIAILVDLFGFKYIIVSIILAPIFAVIRYFIDYKIFSVK